MYRHKHDYRLLQLTRAIGRLSEQASDLAIEKKLASRQLASGWLVRWVGHLDLLAIHLLILLPRYHRDTPSVFHLLIA